MPVQYASATVDDAGQRLDNFLLRRLKGVPKSHIYKLLRTGQVRVNKKRVKPTYRLLEGDEVRLPPVETKKAREITVPDQTRAVLHAAKVYEDDNLVVIDKPRGWAVHGGSSISFGVIETLRESYGNQRLELVHRLDRDTSGLLMIAKNSAALREAQAAFRERQVKKIYEVLVWGKWRNNLRTVRKPLERYETDWGERRVRVSSEGMAARTDFQVLSSGLHASRLEAVLHTGRTHQIRVHTRAMGHPIVGDTKYGHPQLDTDLAASLQHGESLGLCLHATRLRLPWRGEMLKLACDPPPEFVATWNALSDRDISDSVN